MTNNTPHPPTVLISYSHDSPAHADRVLALSDHLRADGIDCILDQYEVSPPEGWPRWMDRHIRAADFVLMICTPTYFRRVMGEEEPDKGHGVAWESTLIYQYIYNAGTANQHFILILLEGAHESDIPVPWQGVKHYRPTTTEGYKQLYRRLTDQPFTPKPALGKLKQLPPRERTQKFMEQQLDNRPREVIENVPYPRNPYFTGRDTILRNLHEALNNDSAIAITQGQAIFGLGGIGKTQTAVEYTYRYRSEYHFIFWVRAETEVELQTGFVAIAKLLTLPEQNATNPADTAQAVKRWLEHTDEWLLVFDNADTPDLLKTFYPRTPRGHILLTSRAQLFDSLGIDSTYALQKLDSQEALDFLSKRTARAQNDQTEKHAAKQLARELGYLPLALEQAAAYIRAKGARFQDYLASFKRQGLSLLNKAGPRTGNYPASVAKTWALNFQEIEQDPVAADILRVSAFLSPDTIPFELLTEGASHLGPVLADSLASEDPLVLNEALEPLTRYSLIRLEVETQEAEPLWKSDLTICEQALGHEQSDTLSSLNNLAILYWNQGKYEQAEPLYQRALEARERVLGPEHPDTARSLENLALLYTGQEKYEEAELLYQRALAMYERGLGADHPDTRRARNNYQIHQEKMKQKAEMARSKTKAPPKQRKK